MISPVQMIGVRIGGGLFSLLLAGAALAAAPTARNVILTRTEAGTARSGASLASRLDLRAPDFRASSPFAPAHDTLGLVMPGAAGNFVPFPAQHRAAPIGSDRQPEENREFAAQGFHMTEESPAQQMARRFHREGLPVARLWQGHSALVSLGLNQRGKPGLWLTQKVP